MDAIFVFLLIAYHRSEHFDSVKLMTLYFILIIIIIIISQQPRRRRGVAFSDSSHSSVSQGSRVLSVSPCMCVHGRGRFVVRCIRTTPRVSTFEHSPLR